MKKIVFILSAILLVSPFLVLAHSDSGVIDGHMMGWGGMMGQGGGWFWLAAFTWLVWLVVGILLIVWLLKKISQK